MLSQNLIGGLAMAARTPIYKLLAHMLIRPYQMGWTFLCYFQVGDALQCANSLRSLETNTAEVGKVGGHCKDNEQGKGGGGHEDRENKESQEKHSLFESCQWMLCLLHATNYYSWICNLNRTFIQVDIFSGFFHQITITLRFIFDHFIMDATSKKIFNYKCFLAK